VARVHQRIKFDQEQAGLRAVAGARFRLHFASFLRQMGECWQKIIATFTGFQPENREFSRKFDDLFAFSGPTK
jgi:hypothetical protein